MNRSRFGLAIAAGSSVALTGLSGWRLCGGAAQAASGYPPALPERSFAYEPVRRLPPTMRATLRDGVRVHEIAIPSTGGGERKALIVLPSGSGPFAGALMVHWLGDAATSNRTEFLDDAAALARSGVVSVLPDTMWSTPGWYEHGRRYATDFSNSLNAVRDLRRAMDVLTLVPGVDPRRIAFVGHDFGGMYGAIFAGIDRRARCYVFMCAAPALTDWYLYLKPPADEAAYVAKMSTLDPTRYLARASIDDALFQYARGDFYVSAGKMDDFYSAAPGRKTLRTYAAKHDLRVPAARNDRRTWLREVLAA